MNDNISHGQCILVVSVANLTADILSIWTVVDNALGIVDVAVLPCATRAAGLGWILHINKDDTCSASVVTRYGTDRVDHVGGFVGNDIMSTANGKTSEMASEILLVAEDDGLLGLDVDELEMWSARTKQSCFKQLRKQTFRMSKI
jgi:hypothetical protein